MGLHSQPVDDTLPRLTDDDDDTVVPARAPGSMSLAGRRGLAGAKASLFGASAVPERFGRYRIGRRLGAGAFGEVYEATDTRLDRRVALKLLRRRASSAQVERLRREARAMAAVDHPNLVEVFEVGHEAGRDFIAMQLVEGTNLAEWAQAEPPGSPERFARALRLVLAAGEGLATAHARGLVHRDFKPANVLVGLDGAVKVADFGLARAQRTDTSADSPEPEEEVTGAHPLGEAQTLTRSGALMGTPLYMSPEQLRGQRADARSDQFSFAVSAWEVLYGKPPFFGRTFLALSEAIAAGPPTTPDGRGVPSWVASALRRGLALDPADRHPSMRAMLRALSGRAARRRRRRGLMAAGTVALAAFAFAAYASQPSGPVCDGAAAREEFAAVWNDERRRAVLDAMDQAGVSHRDASLRAIETGLSAYREQWVDAKVDACRATVGGEMVDDTSIDARMTCLRDGLTTTDALLRRLEGDSREVAGRAVDAIDQLPDPSECATRSASAPAEPPAAAAAHHELAVAKAAHLAGDYELARHHATIAAALAEDAGASRVQAQALFAAGLAANESEAGGGNDDMERAYELAVASGDDWEAAHVAAGLVIGLAHAEHTEQAEAWERHATSVLARLPEDVRLQIRLERARCRLRREQGRYDEAVAHCREAVALAMPLSDAGLQWEVRMALASAQLTAGNLDEATTSLVQLRDDAIARLGPTHPNVGGAWMNLGRAAGRGGDAAEAIGHFEHAIAVFSEAYAPDHAWVVSALLNISAVQMQERDIEGAETTLQRALALCGDHRDARTARVLLNLAEVRRRQHDDREALRLLDRVADIEAETLVPGHLQTAHTYFERAVVHERLGELEPAWSLAQRALQIRMQDTTSPERGSVHALLSRLAQRRGDMEEALRQGALAVEVFAVSGDADPDYLHTLARIAELQVAEGELTAAEATSRQMQQIASEGEYPPRVVAVAWFIAAKVATATGDLERAQTHVDASFAALDRAGIADDGPEREDLRQWWQAQRASPRGPAAMPPS